MAKLTINYSEDTILISNLNSGCMYCAINDREYIHENESERVFLGYDRGELGLCIIDDAMDIYIPIKYCPMCGRRL